MSANKKPVNTPLHLLQQLSGSLLEHLESACSQALADAEKLLAKLEKQRGKAQEKLHKSRTKVQDAAAAGKKKKQAKAHDSVAELEQVLDDLKDRQAETRAYIVELKRDAQDSLKLAAGVGRVQEAAGKAIEARSAKPKATTATGSKSTSAATRTPAKTATPGSAARAAAKPAASKPAASRSTTRKALAAPGAAVKPETQAPAKPSARPARKPAAAKSLAAAVHSSATESGAPAAVGQDDKGGASSSEA
ncbi:AlgP family protein [Pseudomonas rhizosphaerae]|uniref:AlgP family protein n=1 Tax=Pseudomonas rhizosphaerae TaxID=216142 RepID=UPI0006949AE3|nr:AlgP family protein [Pseudomonas rhizosphaerae]